MSVSILNRPRRALPTYRTPTLAKFADPLPVPPTVTPKNGRVTITTKPTRMRLHRDLPESEFWTYDGHLPGPSVETRSGCPVTVEWVSDLSMAQSAYPVTAVEDAPALTQNEPGPSGGKVNRMVASLTPWNVVHLHGAAVAGASDGWTENCTTPGETAIGHYPNKQPATMLWYHDHAMGITRLNVHAGLAGMWFVRDDAEDALGLPSGEYEIPLMIADRNLEVDDSGAFTGRPMHKTETDTAEFYGPYTTVNGVIWPNLDAAPRHYRFRVINASNARVYRLVLLDELGDDLTDRIQQIGSDGGLLGGPCAVPSTGLVLAPAERADLVVDLTGLAGRTLRLVNTAAAPFRGEPLADGVRPGTPDPDPEHRLTEPDVMQISVADTCDGDGFQVPGHLSDVRPLKHNDLPKHHEHRTVLMIERPTGMLQLGETLALGTQPPPAPMGEMIPNGNDLVGSVVPLVDHTGRRTYHAVMATLFNETTNWHVRQGDWEVWRIVNTTGDTHPFHVHLVQFQVLRRDVYDMSGWDPVAGRATAPLTFAGRAPIDTNERGLKDTIRVNPNEMVTIAAKFDGGTGRYMYHCHILEHEDHDMMRPFVVVPPSVLDAMHMPGMAMGGATDPGSCPGCDPTHGGHNHCC